MQYYNGNVFTWKQGRRLSTVSQNGSVVASYDYDENGIRTSKTVNGVEYKYILNGSQIVAETWGNQIVIYLYDELGSPIGMVYRNSTMETDVYETYFFEKNMFGDIVAVYNTSGKKQLSYSYDAFGNCTVTTHVSSNALLNRLRYRGYYHDGETGFYYLNSRYYDPVTCRFINADTPAILGATPMALTDKNLFAYCDNNPVIREDNGGEFWHVVIGAAVGAVANFTISVVQDVIAGNKIDWCDAAVSAGVGFVTGGLSAMGVPANALICVNAGLSAAESVYTDVKENICENGDNNIVDIIAHATINAGVSALFTAAGGTSNGRELSSMYKSSRAARGVLKNGNLTSSVKKYMNKSISTYSKALNRFTKDCIFSAVIETPISTFSSWYACGAYDYLLRG